MYKIKPELFSSMFAVPTQVADKWLKLSGAVQLKVLLTALRNSASEILPETIAEKLNITLEDATDSLNYWVEAGIFVSDKIPEKTVEPNTEKPKKRTIRRDNIKPSREEVTKRGTESHEIALLLREAEMKFARILKPAESSTIVWLYDSEGMNVSTLLLLISFAVQENKMTAGFLERTAVNWINAGVETVADAEKQINIHNMKRTAWNTVRSTFALDSRNPSAKEEKLSYKWVDEYGFGKDILREAYNICVDRNTKISFDYINGILEVWHKNGIKKPEDIKAFEEKRKAKKNDGTKASYDVDKFYEELYKLP